MQVHPIVKRSILLPAAQAIAPASERQQTEFDVYVAEKLASALAAKL
ncbi:MAG: hypothetical protein WA747_01430 [Steroidobacteraceae bacterium]